MTGRRPELAESFRLFLTHEQWFSRDLLLGVVALVAWVAGTGAIVTRVADGLDVPFGIAGETLSPVAVALFAVLWLLVPAVAVVVRLRTRLLNLRGNVEQYYRLAYPGTLLAPPVALVVAVLVVALALRSFTWPVALLLVPVARYLLVRTLAFSYRVYSFSHPLVVQFVAALSTVVLLASAFASVALATGRRALAEQVLLTVGLPTWIVGNVAVEGVVASGVTVVALLPVAAALSYILVQSVVGLAVRAVEPEVDRSKMRTGQRYPPFLPTATPGQTASGSADDEPDDAATGAGSQTGSVTADQDVASTADSASATDGDDAAAPEEEDLDDVSNTRVFTPPADGAGGDVGTGVGTSAGDEAGGDAPSETRAVPANDEDSGSSDVREHCEACGESFTVDTTVRFCPNCGGAL
jgi:hypothetical protein